MSSCLWSAAAGQAPRCCCLVLQGSENRTVSTSLGFPPESLHLSLWYLSLSNPLNSPGPVMLSLLCIQMETYFCQSNYKAAVRSVCLDFFVFAFFLTVGRRNRETQSSVGLRDFLGGLVWPEPLPPLGMSVGEIGPALQRPGWMHLSPTTTGTHVHFLRSLRTKRILIQRSKSTDNFFNSVKRIFEICASVFN